MLQSIPHLDQFLGPWAIETGRLRAMQALVMGLDLKIHLESPQAQAAQTSGTSYPQQIVQGVAVVSIQGTMLKHQSSLPGTTSTAMVRRTLRAAADAANVQAILLHVDSGGGTVAGTAELAADVAAARAKKPLVAYIEDVGASAAYWVASQAQGVYANRGAMVGSIGTYAVIHDTSGKLERDGIKVHVVQAGKFKAAGVPGTKVTDEHLAEFQRLVDGHNAHFVAGVAAGRRITRAQAERLADGRVHLADQALALGLIDGVATLDHVFAQLAGGHFAPKAGAASSAPAPRTKGSTTMNEGYVELFNEQVEARMAKGATRQDAINALAKSNPRLHLLYLSESNARAGRTKVARELRAQAEVLA